MSLCPVCILAGGLGQRLGSLVEEKPKPLLTVAGEPFIFHQLRLLRSHGARRIVICVGYLGERIEETVGGGEEFGLNVAYSYDGDQLAGTAGAVRSALSLLGAEFLVLYGDTYLRIDYGDVLRAFRESDMPALMTVLRNRERWEPSNVVYADGKVLRHSKSSLAPDMEWIDYGLGALSEQAFALCDATESDLSGIYAELAERGLLAGYEAAERFYEIGTPQSLRDTEEFLRDLSSERQGLDGKPGTD